MKKLGIILGITGWIFLAFIGLTYVAGKEKKDEKAKSFQTYLEQGLVYMEAEDAGGPEIIYTKPVRGVYFSHKYHVKDLGLPCESCHSGIFEMEALKSQENSDFVMESLYQGKYCGSCHNGQAAFASNTKCATCHIGVKGMKEHYEKMVKIEKK